jgi:hypothetical protein
MKNNSLALLRAVAIAFGIASILLTSCAPSKGCKGLAAHPHYKKAWSR